MKERPSLLALAEKIQRLSSSLAGVFSYADLCNIVASRSPLTNARTIRRLIRDGMLYKICRGWYTTREPNLWVLATRLNNNAVISLDSVLAKNGLVGTIPERSVSVIVPGGRKRTLHTPVGVIRFFSMQRSLWIIGTKRLPSGMMTTDNEKAYLDVLYYFLKGARFVFDPRNEIATTKLDKRKIKKYLTSYRNKRFRQFVKGLLHDIA